MEMTLSSVFSDFKSAELYHKTEMQKIKMTKYWEIVLMEKCLDFFLPSSAKLKLAMIMDIQRTI